MKISIAKPDLSSIEERNVLEALNSSWISSTGPFVSKFERTFAEICGAADALSVCNGTIALHLALLGLDVRPGDEVLVPSLTYVATANAVRYVGAEPIFVDVDPKTWCIDPCKLEERITRRTKGIIPVHLYGHPADMDIINHIAAIHGLWVVEDAAEAHFATYRGRSVGSLAKIATFSFYGNKLITCGEGGAVTVADPDLALRMRTLRGQGMDPDRRYYFPVTGYNFRLTNLACAILCGQLERKGELLEKRDTIIERYRERLGSLAGLVMQPCASWATISPWLFSMLVDEAVFGVSRDKLAEVLAENGVETRPFFIPLHRLPPFRDRHADLPVTESLSKAGINLPTYSQLSLDEVDHVCDLVTKARR